VHVEELSTAWAACVCPGGFIFSKSPTIVQDCNARLNLKKVEGLKMQQQSWLKFQEGNWKQAIDTRDFIQQNVTPYEGDAGFLVGPSEKTQALWKRCQELLWQEVQKGGVLDIDTERVTGIAAYDPGYIEKNLEVVFGLQTDAPLKRSVNPYGGIRMAEQACEAYGHKFNPQLAEVFYKYRKTHNQGVFEIYTDAMKLARTNAIITGLPDAYGRGRIIGDYRRIALYGINKLITEKKADLKVMPAVGSDIESFQLREEIADQITALGEIKKMAASYGFDISRPAENAQEAVQWVYFGYLAAIKEQNGAAMSLGRVASFLDIYIQRDLDAGLITETAAQELIDQLIVKLRLARQSRTPDYNELFAGDPLWVTEALGGMGVDGRTLVTKTTYRVLQTLYNLGPAPEPNLTVLWSEHLPENFKNFCAKVAMDTSAIQFENDDVMRPLYGDDYAIACCVSAMQVGKQMQFFGARANLGKALLMALNEGRDEISGQLIVPGIPAIKAGYLDYDEVMVNFKLVMDWLCKLYVETLNTIHYMHDKYSYEKAQLALHDSKVERLLATGLAGVSVVADSLSAIKFGKVKPVRNEEGITAAFEIEGDAPCYGNDDERVDNIAQEVVGYFSELLKKQPTYRNAIPTLSILTITSNVVYGKKTGSTPDGRVKGEAYAPGANPMHGRDKLGALAAMNSVTKLPYSCCRDGISYTFSVVPSALGGDRETRAKNLAALLDAYSAKEGHHININVLDRETLRDAMEHPEKYPQLTIRVSGYAVNFIRLNREQQLEVISRTFYDLM
jgi:formate C-acetyltransferase